MFAKLVVVILTIGACACMLLSVRQARLQAAHELARAQLRVHDADNRLWAVRAEIGRRVMPEHVRQMADALGNFRPMLPLPGDADHRGMYARKSGSPDDDYGAPLPQLKPAPQAQAIQADVRTVSLQKTPVKPKTKPKPERQAAAIKREPSP